MCFAGAVPKGSLGVCPKHGKQCHIKKWLPHQVLPAQRQVRRLQLLLQLSSHYIAVMSNQGTREAVCLNGVSHGFNAVARCKSASHGPIKCIR